MLVRFSSREARQRVHPQSTSITGCAMYTCSLVLRRNECYKSAIEGQLSFKLDSLKCTMTRNGKDIVFSPCYEGKNFFKFYQLKKVFFAIKDLALCVVSVEVL